MENDWLSEGNFYNIDIETLFNIASILQLYMHVFESYLIDENDPKYEALREFVLETLGKFSRKIREVGIKLENLEKNWTQEQNVPSSKLIWTRFIRKLIKR